MIPQCDFPPACADARHLSISSQDPAVYDALSEASRVRERNAAVRAPIKVAFGRRAPSSPDALRETYDSAPARKTTSTRSAPRGQTSIKSCPIFACARRTRARQDTRLSRRVPHRRRIAVRARMTSTSREWIRLEDARDKTRAKTETRATSSTTFTTMRFQKTTTTSSPTTISTTSTSTTHRAHHRSTRNASSSIPELVRHTHRDEIVPSVPLRRQLDPRSRLQPLGPHPRSSPHRTETLRELSRHRRRIPPERRDARIFHAAIPPGTNSPSMKIEFLDGVSTPRVAALVARCPC